MPDSTQTPDLYALALALVPDESEAGDLFMAARSEFHLLRLSTAWRQRHGLPRLAETPTPVMLTASQREYGLHLARRRLRRNTARLVLVSLALGLLVWGGGTLVSVSGSDMLRPAQSASGNPARQKESSAPLTIEVSRSEATAGAVTVWWAYNGDRAGEVEPPALVLGDSTITATSVESRQEGGGRIQGSCIYEVITAGHKSARLEARERRTYEQQASSAPFDLTWVNDPAARIVRGQTVLFDHRRLPVGTVTEVILGANYTILRYRASDAVADADTLEVKVDGQVLAAYGELAPMRYLTDGQELVFGPVPPGVRAVEVTPLGDRTGSTIQMRVAPELAVLKRNGSETLVTVDIPLAMDAPWSEATLLTDRQAYRGAVRQLERVDLQVRYEIRSDLIPPGTVVTAVQLHADHMPPGGPVLINLS